LPTAGGRAHTAAHRGFHKRGTGIALSVIA